MAVELEDMKNHLESTCLELKCALASRRVRGLDNAMQLQTQESDHSLEVFVSLFVF